MITPRDSVQRFVSAVVRAELAGGSARSQVAQRTVTRFRGELGKVVGPAGFDVLLARALVLARRDDPSLAGITIGAEGALAGFDDPTRDDDAREKTATTLVAHFLELLVTLVGEDLAMRLVRDLWPGGDEEKGRK